MTDLLESDRGALAPPPPPPESAISTPTPVFPPPATDETEKTLQAQRLRTLAIVAGVALALAVAMGLLWMSARGSSADVTAERDAAIAERDANIDSRQDVAAALISTQSELNTAQDDNQQLQSDLDVALATIAAGEAAEPVIDTERVDELTIQLNDLVTRNQELADRVAALQADLDAQAAVEPGPVVEFDANTTPEFARYVGETLTSRSGSSGLAQAQSECFGATIINTIGLDALGKGLNLSASAADNNLVVGTMQGAAETCGIPLGLVF